MKVKTFASYIDYYGNTWLFDDWTYLNNGKIRCYAKNLTNPSYYGIQPYFSKDFRASDIKFITKLVPSKFERKLCKAAKRFNRRLSDKLHDFKYWWKYHCIKSLLILVLVFVLSLITIFLLTW